MGKTNVIELTTEQRLALENGHRKGKSHALRMRCQMVLLKSEKRSSLEVIKILGCCEIVINNWLNRYEEEGIKGVGDSHGAWPQAQTEHTKSASLQTAKAEIAKHPDSENAEFLMELKAQAFLPFAQPKEVTSLPNDFPGFSWSRQGSAQS
jgi:hypothetical protein